MEKIVRDPLKDSPAAQFGLMISGKTMAGAPILRQTLIRGLMESVVSIFDWRSASRCRLPLLCLMGAVAACGDDRVSPESSHEGTPPGARSETFAVRRVAWETAEEPVDDSRTLFHWSVENDPRMWQVEAPRSARVLLDEPGEASRTPWIRLAGEGPRRVRIEEALDPALMNHVSVRLAAPNPTVFQIALTRGDKTVAESSPISLAPAKDPRWVSLPGFPELSTSPASSLEIRFVGSAPSVAIQQVKVSWVRPERSLDGEARRRLSRNENRDVRHAILFSAQRELVAHATTTADDELRFWAAFPEVVRHRPGPSTSLQITIASQTQQQTKEFSWDSPDQGWQLIRCPAGSFPTGNLELRATLFSSSGVVSPEEALWVTDLFVVPTDPNPTRVLLVTSDTHRADHVGASASGVQIETPGLDGLAQRGVFFENGFSTTNITNPSHVAIMTGQHPRDTGIVNNTTALSPDAQTLAEVFHEAGFLTIASIATQHLSSFSGLEQGFDVFLGPNRQDNYLSAEQVIDDFLAVWEPWRDVPVFVWLHVFDAHLPYRPPQEFADQYYPAERDPFDDSHSLLPRVQRRGVDFQALTDLDYPPAMYKGEVSYLDAQLERVLTLSEFLDSVVAVTADHGECLGQHEIYWSHDGLYPDTIHVPLILSAPDLPGGKRLDRPVHNHDLGRTLLDLAAVAAPFPGRNLWRDDTGPRPRFALSAHRMAAAVTHQDWHLMLQLRSDRRKTEHQVELYHLVTDPECRDNVWDRELARAAQMRTALLRWLDQAEAVWQGQAVVLEESDRQRLAELGYVEDASASPVSFPDDCSCEWCEPFQGE